MGRPLKCAKAGLWRAAVSLMTDGAHWGGAQTCWAIAATAWAIAVRSGPRPGWSACGWRPPSGARVVPTYGVAFLRVIMGGVYEASVSGNGGLEGFRGGGCACRPRCRQGGGCSGVQLGRGGSWLEKYGS